MKTIEQLWKLLENVELVQVRPVEMEAMYKHCFEFKGPTIIEIGSAHGASSIIFGEAVKELGGILYCIDHFPEDYYNQPKFGKYAKERFLKNMRPYKEHYMHIDFPSDKALPAIQNAWGDVQEVNCDVLFIDGNHDYEAVKKDIELYMPTLRKGGYVGFHDYYNVAFGVQKAVDENRAALEGPIKYWDLAVFKKL